MQVNLVPSASTSLSDETIVILVFKLLGHIEVCEREPLATHIIELNDKIVDETVTDDELVQLTRRIVLSLRLMDNEFMNILLKEIELDLLGAKVLKVLDELQSGRESTEINLSLAQEHRSIFKEYEATKRKLKEMRLKYQKEHQDGE